jgi:hypothetical protein
MVLRAGAGLGMQALISRGPPVTAIKAVLGVAAARRWCSEPELEQNGQECNLLVLPVV